MIHKNKARKQDAADFVFDIINNGREIKKEELVSKIMPLSKKKGENIVPLQDIRPISICNVEIKLTEAVMKVLTDDVFLDYTTSNQIAFKPKIGDIELLINKNLHHARSHEHLFTHDIAAAYDSAPKEMLAYVLKNIIGDLQAPYPQRERCK